MKLERKKAKFDLTKVEVEHFLEVMEVENLKRATEEEWHFSCPFPGHAHGDTSPSAYMNNENTAWMCHGCKRKGNAITFLAEIETITIQESRRFLQQQYGGLAPDPDHYSITAELERFYLRREREVGEPQFDVILDEEIGQDYLINWGAADQADPSEVPAELQYMFDRPFGPDVLEEWEIGYDQKRDRITIPVRDEQSRLVGFKGRSWQEGHKPKYLVMGGDRYGYPRYSKSRIVFGLHKAIDMYATFNEIQVPSNIGELVICEGELDVISLHEKGFWNAVSVAGSEFSSMQSRIIRRWADSVTIFFDSDEGGHAGTAMMIEALKDFIPLKVVPDHEGDPNEMTTEKVNELLDEAEPVSKIRLMTGVVNGD